MRTDAHKDAIRYQVGWAVQEKIYLREADGFKDNMKFGCATTLSQLLMDRCCGIIQDLERMLSDIAQQCVLTNLISAEVFEAFHLGCRTRCCHAAASSFGHLNRKATDTGASAIDKY
jgi:hypothetical protein